MLGTETRASVRLKAQFYEYQYSVSETIIISYKNSINRNETSSHFKFNQATTALGLRNIFQLLS